MIDLIRASTLGSNPQQLQMPVKVRNLFTLYLIHLQDMNGSPFPPKSLFLTVTTTRVEGGQVNQVIDFISPCRSYGVFSFIELMSQ